MQVLQGHVQPVPIVQQARSLHSDIATNIALRECIRIHKASIAEFKKGEDHVVGKTPVATEMSRRIRMISRTLNYFEGAAQTNLEQLRNLLNLVRTISLLYILFFG
jgi:hypothetical protein